MDKELMHKQQKILGHLCILLPLLSVGFGLIGYFTGVNNPGWYESISATFYANSKMMMIGLLCATSIYFWAYKGYDKADDIITKIGAITALMIVAFPCSDGKATTEPIVGLFCLPLGVSGAIHNISALVLYTSFIVQTFRFTKHGKVMTDMKKKRNIFYYCCIGVMLFGTLFIFSCNIIDPLKPYHFFILIGESFLQLGYGCAWLCKSEAFKCLNDK